jgi:hypothetical protein
MRRNVVKSNERNRTALSRIISNGKLALRCGVWRRAVVCRGVANCAEMRRGESSKSQRCVELRGDATWCDELRRGVQRRGEVRSEEIIQSSKNVALS